MNDIANRSIPVARALAEMLAPMITQAEVGKLDVPAYMLRMALKEIRRLVEEADGRCGRVATTADFLRFPSMINDPNLPRDQ